MSDENSRRPTNPTDQTIYTHRGTVTELRVASSSSEDRVAAAGTTGIRDCKLLGKDTPDLMSSPGARVQMHVVYPDGSTKWSREFELSKISSIDWSKDVELPKSDRWEENPAFLVSYADGSQEAHCPIHHQEC